MTQPPIDPPPQTLSYAKPPAGIEWKAQHLATLTVRTLGVYCVLFGMGCGSLSGVSALFSDPGSTNTGMIIAIIILEACGALGIVYLVCAHYIGRGSRKAGMIALILAGVQEGFASLFLTIMVLAVLRSFATQLIVALAICALLVLGLVLVIWHLIRFLRPVNTGV